MKFEFKNLGPWADEIRRRATVFKEDAKVAVADEIRLLLEYAMRITPPKSMAQGRKAVVRDITRTMRPITSDGIRSKSLVKIIEKRDIVGYNAAAAHFRGTTLAGTRAVEFEERIHTGQRDSRMRVGPSSLNGKTVLLGRQQASAWSAYVKKVQANVGIACAGWWPALQAVGGSEASWITRHGTTSGDVIDELGFGAAAATANPRICLINKTGWGAREGMRILNDAVRLRTGSLKSKINRALAKMNT